MHSPPATLVSLIVYLPRGHVHQNVPLAYCRDGRIDGRAEVELLLLQLHKKRKGKKESGNV